MVYKFNVGGINFVWVCENCFCCIYDILKLIMDKYKKDVDSGIIYYCFWVWSDIVVCIVNFLIILMKVVLELFGKDVGDFFFNK